MAIHLTPEANPTVQEGTLFVDSATGEFNVAGRTVPHIIPGVLYPSYVASGTANKLLDGTTDHSGAFGTEQADGRKYYYTNIAGSKPIKDPRIGAYFGSQRHKFKSLQLLEQETATHGDDVFSIDGREWVRAVGGVQIDYGSSGTRIQYNDTSAYVEIVGYFNDANVVMWTKPNREVEWSLDGGSLSSNNYGSTTITTPLQNRYVDAGSVVNFGLSASLGIHTLKIQRQGSGGSSYIHGCELITQDTSNRNNIQIPSQNVVSYGKKFNVSGTPHYDPFNGFTSGSSVSSYVDTATSLGCDNWKYGSTYYRPYNGGRVVKWVDSSGVIKTSVTLMPPNAKSIGNSSSLTNGNAKANASASNDTFYPTFETHTTDVNEDNLHDVAKTFYWREFGNGGANGNTSYTDASNLNTGSDIAYVMDDGLSSFTADDVDHITSPANALNLGANDRVHITFIGTGISIFSPNWDENANAWHHIAQNLPYGTHILRIVRAADNNSTILLDGVEVKGSTATAPWIKPSQITFYQPKKPLIPEDACVLADYMLMADYVQQTDAEDTEISKGLRLVGASRDIKYDGAIHSSHTVTTRSVGYLTGMHTGVSPSGSGTPLTLHLPFFGTNIQYSGHGTPAGARTYTFTTGSTTGSSVTQTSLGNSVAVDADMDVIENSGLSLDQHTVNITMPNGGYATGGLFVVSPIHTSHHYQYFETPFLNELVGGDRNMEQHNLVCSPDGKTWDQITRDTSYISKLKVNCQETDSITYSSFVAFTDWRGKSDYPGASRNFGNKDFAIAYDRIICLVEGKYEISMTTSSNDDSETNYLLVKVNGLEALTLRVRHQKSSYSGTTYVDLKRGDIIQVRGEWGGYGTHEYENFSIVRV